MINGKSHVWVTSAVSDADAQKALFLCNSLRRVYSTRRIAVILSSNVSTNLRQGIHNCFDFVFILDEDQNTAGLDLENFAKLYALMALRSYDRCVYLAPCILALRNCDEIFAEATDGFFPFDWMNAPIFAFKPSIHQHDHLTNDLQITQRNDDFRDNAVGEHFEYLDKHHGKVTCSIGEKYCRVIQRGKMLLGGESNIALIHLMDYPTEDDISWLENGSILGKLVATHWLTISRTDVYPLINGTNIDESSMGKMLMGSYAKEPIAIVGMSCRYPSSNNLEEFWDILFHGRDGTCTEPAFRWTGHQRFQAEHNERKPNAGYLNVPVDEFDGNFFGISPKEISFMDPQHRLLLELAWEALEDACVDPHSLRGSSGSVFMGSWIKDYKEILLDSGNDDFYRIYMGNSIGAAAARISFLLGMTGPSISTDSGCSSAMVAVHLACKSLRQGETHLALACGVNLLLHPLCNNKMPLMVSPDGHSKTFSEDANGFARAEGGGVLVLKRLSDAYRDGDRIWGLIRGSAVSQEGMSKSMGTPTVQCESLVMRKALEDSGVLPEEVDFVEAHGTGTPVGDPMEVAAISNAYKTPNRKQPLIIGSVKTNVGHTESCSGITGIMKTILAMHHEIIPAHRNFTKLNPAIHLKSIPAVLPLERMDWKRVQGKPRIAGVSSFGITGTDAHVIVEEPPQNKTPKVLALHGMKGPVHILKLSAKTEEAMTILLEKYKDTYLINSNESIADICYSANTGRANFCVRAAVIGKSKEEICKFIEEKKYIKGEVSREGIGKICFLFTGQGCQYPGMAKQLYDTSPIFRMHFDYCDQILKVNYNINITKVLWSNAHDGNTEINRTIYSQTSIFCVEYSLLKLWESWGVKPDYALGHSLGECAAVVCAGIVSVEDAIKLVAERCKLIDELPMGKMLVIKAGKAQVDQAMKLFADGDDKKILDYAAFNSADQTVVAGDSNVLANFATFLVNNNIKNIVLGATHAFHSRHMDPILEKYRVVTNSVTYRHGNGCEYISGMRGDLLDGEFMDDQYWLDHTRLEVNFLDASRKAVELGCRIFIEIGPQPVLSALTQMNSKENLLCLPSLRKNEAEWSTMLSTLATLYVTGINIDWKGLYQFQSRKKVRLPLYPFIRKRFWPEVRLPIGNAKKYDSVIHPLTGPAIPNATGTRLFQCDLSLRSHPWLQDHAIGGNVIFPGGCYLEMCLATGFSTLHGSYETSKKPRQPMKLENLVIIEPLPLDESTTTHVQTAVQFNAGVDNGSSIKILRRLDEDSSSEWLLHATATFSPIVTTEEQLIPFDVAKFRENIEMLMEDIMVEHLYQNWASVGLNLGPVFQSINGLWMQDSTNSILVKVKAPVEETLHDQYITHPIILDTMIQAIMMLKCLHAKQHKLYIPRKIGKFIWLSNKSDAATSDLYIHAVDAQTSCNKNYRALLIDSTGNLLAVMDDVEIIATTVDTVKSLLQQHKNPIPDMWKETWQPQMGPMQYRVDLDLCSKSVVNMKTFYRENDLRRYNDRPDLIMLFSQLDTLVYYITLNAFFDCGWEPEFNQHFSEQDLFQKLNIEKQFRKQFGYFLEILQQEGILRNDDDNTWTVARIPPTAQLIKDVLSSPLYTIELVEWFRPTLLLSKLGGNLASILQGNKSPLTVLYPEGSAGINNEPSVEEFYSHFGNLIEYPLLITDITTTWLKDYAKKASEAGLPRSVFRILEIGTGTCGHTDNFLKLLEEHDIDYEYTYTDISVAALPAAEQRFQQYSTKMKFKTLNIEEDPITQGFVPCYFDIVYAVEVIHTTKDIRRSIRNAKSLLRPNGIFSIGETTRVSRMDTAIFGLLEGHWDFEDLDLRPNHCTMSCDIWRKILQEAGFHVDAYPLANDTFTYLQCVKNEVTNQCASRPKGNEEKNLKTWLVFHQECNPTSEFLITKIPQVVVNRQVISITPGSSFETLTNNSLLIRPHCEQDFIMLMECLSCSSTVPIEGIVYCWSLDKRSTKQENILKPYFYLGKSLRHLKQTSPPRLCVLMKEVAPIKDNDLFNFHFSTIWGFTKSLMNEIPDLSCKCVDVGSQNDENEKLQILLELFNGTETQVAYHNNYRYVPKLSPHAPQSNILELPVFGGDRFQLILPATNAIEDLKLGPLDPIVLGPRETEIQVKASALSYRDLLNVLKPSRDFKNSNFVGRDFSGVVMRVGPNVSKLAVGDTVFGVNITSAALPTHIKLHEDVLTRVPDDMTFCDASTLPSIASVCYLIDKAKVTPSDTVLIHTATGGVGLSAIQICKYIGATVIATAGSNRKRNYLKSLGIRHIFNSRNTDYEKEILQVTKGRGVNVILNSLSDEGFMEATLNACAMCARFVEMSKLGIWKPEEVHRRRPDIKYTAVDLTKIDANEWRRAMCTLQELLNTNVISPIPYIRFGTLNVRDALYYMKKAKHVGKVVCVFPVIKQKNGRTEVHTPMFHANASYLITGGLGGVGFEVCKWMLKMGARFVLLAGRSPPHQVVREAIGELNEDYTAKVTFAKLDVSSFEECKNLIQFRMQKMGWPILRGIMHAAGTLHDGMIENQSWEDLSSTFPSKLNGTLNLHEMTKHNSKLEHFMLFSSATSLFGSPGQSSSAAGNSFEDAFVHYRHSMGLPAISVNWGQWGEVGIGREMKLPGIKPFSNQQGITALTYALQSQRSQIGVINIESPGMPGKHSPHVSSYMEERVWRPISGSSEPAVTCKTDGGFWKQYDSAESDEQKKGILKDSLRCILRKILNLDIADTILDTVDFEEMGVDSLMFAEIHNELQTILGERLVMNAGDIKDCNSVERLAERLLRLTQEYETDVGNAQTP